MICDHEMSTWPHLIDIVKYSQGFYSQILKLDHIVKETLNANSFSVAFKFIFASELIARAYVDIHTQATKPNYFIL